MRRTILIAAVGLSIGFAGVALGMGGNLDRPSIAVPTDPKTKEGDPVVQKIANVLQSHHKRFTGGSFLNSHSVLYFAGGAEGVNALAGDLAKIAGAKVRVKFSKEAGVTRLTSPSEGMTVDRPCDCKIEHLGWGEARSVTLTIYLGGGRIEPDKLELPAITGQATGPNG